LKKITSLKLSSSILFWFGILFQILVTIRFSLEYYREGTISELSFELIFSEFGIGIAFILYTLFGHLLHIAFSYLIAKGKIIGIILGLGLCVYEIVSFLVPEIEPTLFTSPFGIPIRILFGIIIILIIYGRDSRIELQVENWKPWKNPIKENKKR